MVKKSLIGFFVAGLLLSAPWALLSQDRVAAATSTHSEILSKIQESNNFSSSFSCSIHQKKHSALLSEDLSSEARFYTNGEGAIRFETLSPAKRVFVMNGETISLTSGGSTRTTDISTNRRYRSILSLVGKAGGTLIPEEEFDIAIMENTSSYELRLKPRRRELLEVAQEILLSCDKTTGLIRRIVLLQGEGEYTQMDISDAKKGEKLSPELFSTN